MRLVETHDYKFPTHLLAPLINGDPVDEEDRESFEAFLDKLERYKKEYDATDYVVSCESDSYFAKSNCLYGSGLGCSVNDIQVHFIR